MAVGDNEYFCPKCGLNVSNTGLCPVCDKERLAQEQEKERQARPNLILHLKKTHFDDIVAGIKTEEYRLVVGKKDPDYWKKRLSHKLFNKVIIFLRYPKKSEVSAANCIEFPWNGFEIKTIVHPEFGDKPVEVFAIKLCKEVLKCS